MDNLENTIKTKVALLEQDIGQDRAFINRLDNAISKLSEVSSSIKELLAVHDHKLHKQDDINVEIYSLIRDLKAQNTKEHEIVKSSINELSRRIDRLERWRYAVVTGATALGFLASTFIQFVAI